MVQVVSDWTRGQLRIETGRLVLNRTIRIVQSISPEGNVTLAAGPSLTVLGGMTQRIEVIRLDVFHPEHPSYAGGPHWHSVVHEDRRRGHKLNEGVSTRLPPEFNPAQWFADQLSKKALVEIMLAAGRQDVADWLIELVIWENVQREMIPVLPAFAYDRVMPFHELALLERPE